MLTNDGELSKAFATMVQRGVAPPTENIISQLRTKFPRRRNKVKWPSKSRIEQLRSMVERTVSEMEMDACDDNDGNFDRKQKMVLSKQRSYRIP